MRRATAIAFLAALAGLYVVLLLASIDGDFGVVVWTAIALHFLDEFESRFKDTRIPRLLRQIGADTMWRVFVRQVLLVVFLLRTGRVSRAELAVLVCAVIAHHLLLSLKGGLALVIEQRRMRRVETRNLPVPGAELPPALPAWVLDRRSRWQRSTELLFLAGLVWSWAGHTSTPITWSAALMVLAALAFPLAMLPQLAALLKLPDEHTRLAAAQEAISAAPPLVILYFSGGLNAVYQVNMWFETLERLDRPALVVLRERRYLSRLPETTVPVLCLPFTSDVMNFDFTGSRVALYVANVGRNIHFLRIPTLKSAFIGHGDSDKVASFNPYSKVYDQVWVAGEAGRDRYLRAQVGVRSEDIVVVGRPQLDGIQESVPRPPGAPFTVLYAPTWEGWTDDIHASSLPTMGREIIEVLLSVPGVRVVFKPHPLTGTVRPEAARAREDICALIAAAGPEHLIVAGQEKTLYDCFDDSDALISDISSVVSDYLRSEKPYFVTNGAGIADRRFREEYPSAGAAYLIGPGASGLGAGLELARGADPRSVERHRIRRYLLGDPEVASITLFRAAVDALAAQAPEPTAAAPEADEDLLLEGYEAAEAADDIARAGTGEL